MTDDVVNELGMRKNLKNLFGKGERDSSPESMQSTQARHTQRLPTPLRSYYILWTILPSNQVDQLSRDKMRLA